MFSVPPAESIAPAESVPSYPLIFQRRSHAFFLISFDDSSRSCPARFVIPASCVADAAPIREVSVSVTGAGGMPPAVEKRITASISAIGNRILVGKDESLFRSHESEYDKVLADIVNRVVVGYVVDDISAAYGEKTALHVSLTPVGQMIREVETEIDYGNLSPEAAALVKKDSAGVPLLMSQLLSGLPVDSVGWAESVSESAGRELLKEILPEFTANFEVTSGEKTKCGSPSSRRTIVRTGKLTLHKTTIPRLLMLRAVNETEHALRSLEGFRSLLSPAIRRIWLPR